MYAGLHCQLCLLSRFILLRILLSNFVGKPWLTINKKLAIMYGVSASLKVLLAYFVVVI